MRGGYWAGVVFYRYFAGGLYSTFLVICYFKLFSFSFDTNSYSCLEGAGLLWRYLTSVLICVQVIQLIIDSAVLKLAGLVRAAGVAK
jgi:hypothetical protein